jgi:Zn-dependent protease with chaperone function
MSGPRARPLPCVALIACVLLSAGPGFAAEPVPSQAELQELLRDEPISLETWAAWKPRLRDWSGGSLPAAMPAFESAFAFVRTEKRGRGFRPQARVLERDAVALMLLGGSVLYDPDMGRRPAALAGEAERILKESLKRDGRLARTHDWLAEALRRRELAPPGLGGPAVPSPSRLREARGQFALARRLDPTLPPLPPRDEGQLAALGDQHADAERLLRPLLAGTPDANVARWYARAVALDRAGAGRRAALLQPVMGRFPRDGVLAGWHGLALGRDGDAWQALKEYERARGLGTDPARLVGADNVRKAVQHVRALERKQKEEERRKAQPPRPEGSSPPQAAKATPPPPAWWHVALTILLWFFLVYGVVIALMFLAGLVLARFTYCPGPGPAAGQGTARGQVARTTHEARLAGLYGAVLALALVLFYAAVPFVLGGMLLLFLAVLGLTVFVRRDAQTASLHADLVRASGGSLWGVFRALFAGAGRSGPGLRKTAADCPRLYETLREVARRVDTGPVDEVYLAPGSSIGVRQDGRGPFGVFGSRRRVLILGLSSLHFLTVTELKAILAHEYAHFSHKDTLYIRFIYQVTLSIDRAMRGLAAAGGWLVWVNPFYWFFYLYSKAYAVLSAGFSRSREFLADRMACALYGADAFTRALETVCIDGALFEGTIWNDVARLARTNKAFVNMYLQYRRFRDREDTQQRRARLAQELRDERPSLFDSHPTFAQRVAAVRGLPGAEQADAQSAMTLFEDPEAVERELTDFLTAAACRGRRR